jgi:hypothetical protein
MRRETFSTPGEVRLDLEIPAGQIEIETSNTDETHVELEALSKNDAIRELVDQSRVELVRRGDRHEVIVEVKSRSGVWFSFSGGPDIRFGGPDIQLRVSCPHGAELDVSTKSADVQARGEYGPVEVKTASGDVSIGDISGDARFKTASGDVHVDTISGRLESNSASGDLHVTSVRGDASVQLVSGDVHIGEADESVSVNTVSGDQIIRAVMQGRVDLKAISGDIIVGIRRGSRLFVDANTVSGSTSSEVELGDAPGGSEASTDGPAVEVYAKTVSGDVRIERAPAPRAQEQAETSDRP